MTVTAGALTQLAVSSNSAKLSSPAATGGTSPYTYQWYRSTTTGFTPGAGNLIAGATSLTLNDTGLIPNLQYFYVVKATDTGHSNDTDDSPQLAVVTTPTELSQNQFAQSDAIGVVDLRLCLNTISVQIDVSQSTPLYAGDAVTFVDSAGGVPKVVGCAASSDEVYGFINYDVKTVAFTAGKGAEISMAGNVIYLYATTAIARGERVELELLTGGHGGVAAYSTNNGADVVGWAVDKAAGYGDLIRVMLITPSFQVSS